MEGLEGLEGRACSFWQYQQRLLGCGTVQSGGL